MIINIRRKKFLYLILSVVIISIFSLSIVYAALSSTLSILGNSEVVASNWDIHLDNIDVTDGSVSANSPSIDSNSSVGFDVELDKPGDFYEFTVDVVNGGTIDAMIDSVVKTPNLTEEQLKYVKYEITYENGESISNKQILKKGTSTPIKVRVEYRKDIVANDLPTTKTELSLKLTLIYVQSDGTGSVITNNGYPDLRVVSGDINTIGSEVCIGEECFYVIDNDTEVVSMLAKYNLYVGNVYDSTNGIVAIKDPTGIQSSTAIGWNNSCSLKNPCIGTTAFASTNYWSSNSNYPLYVYDENSKLSSYLDNYKVYLETKNVSIAAIKLISYEFLTSMGCNGEKRTCSGAPNWLYSSSYWTGSAYDTELLWYIFSNGSFGGSRYSNSGGNGVRPVIDIPVSEF